ncbi:MAG: hypothetical protein ABSC08_01475 [Bryobacteraceae bacterium]
MAKRPDRSGWIAIRTFYHHWLPPVMVGSLAVWSLLVWGLQLYPPVGVYISILAVLGVIVTIWPPESNWGKAAWLLVFFGLMGFEISSLFYHERQQAEEHARDIREEKCALNRILQDGQDHVRSILSQGETNLQNILKQQQRDFSTTMSTMVQAEHMEGNRFSALLDKEQELYEHEEQLAGSLHGRLLPGSEPTPANVCPPAPISEKEVLILWGNIGQAPNVSVVTRFPHIVVKSRQHGPVLTFDRVGSSIVVLLDVRSSDGKILARLNRDGWVVNRNKILEARAGKNNLVVIDEFGNDVIRINYFNPNAISVSGYIIPNISGNCIVADGFSESVTIP